MLGSGPILAEDSPMAKIAAIHGGHVGFWGPPAFLLSTMGVPLGSEPMLSDCFVFLCAVILISCPFKGLCHFLAEFQCCPLGTLFGMWSSICCFVGLVLCGGDECWAPPADIWMMSSSLVFKINFHTCICKPKLH